MKKKRASKGFSSRLESYSKTASASLSITKKKPSLTKALGYTVAAVSGIGLSASGAAAAVVSTLSVTTTITAGAMSINMDAAGGNEFRIFTNIIGTYNTGKYGVYVSGVASGAYVRANNATSASATRFVASNSVSTAFAFYGSALLGNHNPYGGAPKATAGNFSTASTATGFGSGYIGVRFIIPGGPPTTHYGWINLAVDHKNKSFTVFGWAYESAANTPIHVPVVPEPASLALLAMGAGGIVAWRKRKIKKAYDE